MTSLHISLLLAGCMMAACASDRESSEPMSLASMGESTVSDVAEVLDREGRLRSQLDKVLTALSLYESEAAFSDQREAIYAVLKVQSAEGVVNHIEKQWMNDPSLEDWSPRLLCNGVEFTGYGGKSEPWDGFCLREHQNMATKWENWLGPGAGNVRSEICRAQDTHVRHEAKIGHESEKHDRAIAISSYMESLQRRDRLQAQADHLAAELSNIRTSLGEN